MLYVIAYPILLFITKFFLGFKIEGKEYDKIRHFKNGAFDFAVRNNVPVVPMVIKFNKPKKISNLIKTRTTITLVIQKPIYPNRLLGKKDAIIDLKERVRDSMCEELEQDA